MTNVEIARRRGVSVDAVKFHVTNALAKLGLPDRRALRAWFRAPRDGALAVQGSKSMNEKPLSGAIGQIARSVSDIGTSEKWYRDVLGLPHLYTFGTLAFFDCGGTRLMLAQEKSGAVKESILYLRVSDIVPAHEALKQRGVQVHTRAAHDSSPRRRHRGMDGVLRGSRRPPAGHHGPNEKGPINGDIPIFAATTVEVSPRQIVTAKIGMSPFIGLPPFGFDIFPKPNPQSTTPAKCDTVLGIRRGAIYAALRVSVPATPRERIDEQSLQPHE